MARRLARLPGAQLLAVAVHLLVVVIEDAGIAAGAAALVIAGPLWRHRAGVVGGHGGGRLGH
ncbi:hypothetical protein D9M72_312750 [compost metagenome]